MLFIFDLDLTLICSKHRQLTKPDGSLDLEHWVENNTDEKIMQDSLLPLGRQVSHYLRNTPPSRRHIACTARVMRDADYQLLEQFNLQFDMVLSRPLGCTDADYILKESLLRKYALTQKIPFARLMKTAVFWDDNEKIREHFTGFGVKCYNPIEFNERNKAA